MEKPSALGCPWVPWVCLGSKVDCLWDSWVDWSVCQFSCGGGESVRTRKVKVMATGNGAPWTWNMVAGDGWR